MATRKEETSEHAFRNLCILLCGGNRMNRLDEGWITSPDVYFYVPNVVDYVPGRIFFYFEPKYSISEPKYFANMRGGDG